MSKNASLWLAAALVITGAGFVAYQAYATNLAHTTFERYYAFRGCAQLLDKTDTYGDCTLRNGQTIKIVLIDGKWYLDGDGPGVW